MVGATDAGAVVLTVGLVAITVEAVRRRDVAATVNSVASLALLALGLLITLGLFSVHGDRVASGPVLPLWIGGAGFLHSLGMLGLYETRRWWDALTHVVSAALVAAVTYAGIVVVPVFPLLDNFVGAAGTTVVVTFWIGVAWELLELVAREIGERFDVEPVLVYYGWRDTAGDLVFDLLGAALVVLVDLRVFVPVAEQLPGLTRTVLVGAVSVATVGSLLLALVVVLGNRT